MTEEITIGADGDPVPARGRRGAGGARRSSSSSGGGRAGADPAQPRRLRGDDGTGSKACSRWTVDGVTTEVGPGEALFIPRGVVHRFENVHDTDATQLAIVTPGVLGPGYFRDLAAIVDAAAGGPPDLPRSPR